jgi:glycosyltransferase involved in cell wall biosynthesis
MRSLLEAVMREGIAEKVDFLGFLSGDALSDAYASSGCYLSTSALEAFPLPPLEAISAGTPAVVPDTAPFEEVCGDAGLYFADDDGAIARRVADALAETRRGGELRRRARERSAMFSWSVFGGKLTSALSEVAAVRSPHRSRSATTGVTIV